MIEIYSPHGVPIKAWVEGVEVEADARIQLRNIANLPVVGPHVAVMPDVHLGIGATVGSVVPTRGAIIPAAVGVDIGCGMMAVKLPQTANDLPDSLSAMRSEIERMIPHGRTANGGQGDRGAWRHPADDMPVTVRLQWLTMSKAYDDLVGRHPGMLAKNTVNHLGTLGTGNHFVEVCLDKGNRVWVMLHSGSRGVGNRIGSYFIELAKNDMLNTHGNLPTDKALAYLTEGTKHFDDYVEAVAWAQNFARVNREIMMEHAILAVEKALGVPLDQSAIWKADKAQAINCHHNYVQKEHHFGEDLYVTRKGAVNADKGKLGIIPGSMGARSFIVRGLGNPESFNSCSHGAGRRMSRTAAKNKYTVKDLAAATAGVECRKDRDVLDEIPYAYKDIDAVMAAQSDLVEVVAELRQVLCVKG